MANGELVENLQTIFTYNIISLFFVFSLLFVYGVGKDYLLHGIYEISLTMHDQGLVQSWVSDAIITFSNSADIIPQYIDVFWLLLTATLFVELVIASYYAKREGWFGTLGFMTIGILFFLFMSGIFSQIGDWIQVNLINGLFANVSYATPFLNYYLNNMIIINTLLVVVCVVVNFIDLDLSTFERRKDRESLEEVQ